MRCSRNDQTGADLLVGTRPGDAEQRQAVLDTWAKNRSDVFFVTSTKVEGGAVLDLPPEAEEGGYMQLPRKVLHYLLPRVHAFHTEHPFDYLVKVDPDTYVNVPRLEEVCSAPLLTGHLPSSVA